jgi:hypothetical protein
MASGFMRLLGHEACISELARALCRAICVVEQPPPFK